IPDNPKHIGKQTEKTKNVVTLDKSREKNANHNAVDAEDKQSSNIEPDIIPEGFSECKVYLSSPTYRAVGRGKVHNCLGETIHTRPLPIDHVKVSLEVAFEPNAFLPVSIDDEALITVRDAIGTFVAWPKNLVSVNKSISDNLQNKGTKNSIVPKGNGEENRTKGSNEVDTARNGSYCSYLTMHVQLLMRPSDLLPSIMMAKETFGVSFEEKLGVDEINHVVMHQWIGVSAVCTYIRYLYEKFMVHKQLSKRFFFLSPHVTSFLVKKDEQIKAIVDLLVNNNAKDKLVLAPYNTSVHWVLLAINLKAETIYHLDPMHKDPDPHMTDVFNT
ncbi:Unknown protein, partial [Striga hermonthica]